MKKLKKLITLVMLSLSLTLFTPELLPVIDSVTSVEAATIKLNKSKATLIKGQTLKLKITGSRKKVTWKSSSKKIAHVSSAGKVTAKSKGKATISAKINNRTYKCKITVEAPKLNKSTATLTKGDTLQLKLTGTTQKISWKSSAPSIADVNSKGSVITKNSGNCTIIATVAGKTYKCAVTVENPIENVEPTPEPTPELTPEDTNTNSNSTLTHVWLSATGTKYHAIPDCGRMNPNTARQITRSEAIAYGYDSCDKCF